MNKTLSSLAEFEEIVKSKDGVIVYFANSICGACDVLEAKITALLQSDYPKMDMYIVSTENHPEIAGQNRIFAAPSFLIFFTGKEQARFGRTVGISQIVAAIDRPYHMVFDA